MDLSMITGLMTAMVAAGTPYLLASLGEIVTEKGGILNLGVEGMMLVGAVAGYITAVKSNSLLLAILVGVLAGGLMAAIHAFLCITLKANQVVSGLALTIFGTGLSAFLGKDVVGVVTDTLFHNAPIPGLRSIPVVGEALFNQTPLVYVAILMVPVLWFVLSKTSLGMKIRSAGENPAATDAAGVNVFAVQYGCTIFGGMMAGLAGVFLTLAYNNTWMENISAGQGWIAVALVIFARWNPWKALLGSYLFGLVAILGLRLQAVGISIPTQLFNMLPYLLTLAVMIFGTGKVGGKRSDGAPASLSVPYDREAR
ncbi:MAG: ABC transporter permease [Eubacteriales bacterium]|nr:ABC transporter permease [Eubacteriales bacterium]